MRFFTLAFVLVIVITPLSLNSQVINRPVSVFDDYLNVPRSESFLSIPGLDFNSSFGFSYFSSNSGFSAGYGFYIGHFSLNITDNLTLRWDLGLRSMMTGPQEYRKPEVFIPNIDLTYRKGKNFALRLQFQQVRYPYLFHSLYR